VQEVLEKANQMFNLNPRLGESLLQISERIQDQLPPGQLSSSAASSPAAVAAPSAAAPELPKALRGLNPKLLEKIRQVFPVPIIENKLLTLLLSITMGPALFGNHIFGLLQSIRYVEF